MQRLIGGSDLQAATTALGLPNDRSSPIALCRSGAPAHATREGGDTLTALPPVATPVGSECQLVQGDWLEITASPVLRPSISNAC